MSAPYGATQYQYCFSQYKPLEDYTVQRMRILVSNDDGIYSPGLAALAEVAGEFGTVRVVAPDVEQSAMGHAITASRPLTYRRTQVGNIEAYRVNGTPADCVALGAYHWDKVDLVLSGVNLGLNIGNSICTPERWPPPNRRCFLGCEASP